VVVDDLVARADSDGLVITRGVDPLELTVHREGAQATHADRELVMTWAARWSDRASVTVGDLADLDRRS
jgi:hypothetical protein